MITVERLNEGTLTLTFKYFQEYIDRVKSLGAKWNADIRAWELEESMLNLLDTEFSGELFYKTPKWELTGEKPPDYSKLYKFDTVVDIDSLGFKINPYAYQEFGIKFLIDRLLTNNMAFVCDDVGLGKTIEAIGAMKYLLDNDLVKDITIICKKSLKTQWAEEIQKFIDIDADIYVVPDLKAKRLKVYEEVKSNTNNTITILNYHVLLKDSKLIKTDFTIYDEVHSAKKHDGEINKSCRELTSGAQYCLFMTGTPIMARPDDLYGIVSIKDKKYFGSSYKAFEKKYLVKSYGRFVQTVGYRNLDELRDKVQRLIIRRTANEVAIDLPDVLEITNYIDTDDYQKRALSFVYGKTAEVEEKLNKLKETKNKTQEIKGQIETLEASLKGYIAIEQIIANNPRLFYYSKSKGIKHTYESYTPDSKYVSKKYLKLLDIVEEIKEANNKVIIFTKYETVVKHLSDFLENQKIKCTQYFGAMNQDQRDKTINNFKYDDTITCLVATDAACEGLNLQCANTVIHLDLPYNQAILNQRNGRVRRAGSQYSTVISYNLISKGTIDESIFNKIKETKRDFDVFVSANSEQSKLLKELSN